METRVGSRAQILGELQRQAKTSRTRWYVAIRPSYIEPEKVEFRLDGNRVVVSDRFNTHFEIYTIEEAKARLRTVRTANGEPVQVNSSANAEYYYLCWQYRQQHGEIPSA